MARDWDAFMRQVAQWARQNGAVHRPRGRSSRRDLAAMGLAPTAAVRWQPAVNVYETADAVVVQAEIHPAWRA